MSFNTVNGKIVNLSIAGERHSNGRRQRYGEYRIWFDSFFFLIERETLSERVHSSFTPSSFSPFSSPRRSDKKLKQKIERIFRIWEQRDIYNEEFLSDLHDLSSINTSKKPQPNENNYVQATITVSHIRNCVRLENETDKCFKLLSKTPLCDTDTLHLLKGNFPQHSHSRPFKKNINWNCRSNSCERNGTGNEWESSQITDVCEGAE